MAHQSVQHSRGQDVAISRADRVPEGPFLRDSSMPNTISASLHPWTPSAQIDKKHCLLLPLHSITWRHKLFALLTLDPFFWVFNSLIFGKLQLMKDWHDVTTLNFTIRGT
ncbi:uncharacterized protein LOC143683695 [Tamandua tetradactyla]|uniref:uncharacterized protein LOC143683695 n=1 Tax=Tamandua tetradactyla TaxID=48850 RepID=UPI00405474B7